MASNTRPESPTSRHKSFIDDYASQRVETDARILDVKVTYDEQITSCIVTKVKYLLEDGNWYGRKWIAPPSSEHIEDILRWLLNKLPKAVENVCGK